MKLNAKQFVCSCKAKLIVAKPNGLQDYGHFLATPKSVKRSAMVCSSVDMISEDQKESRDLLLFGS